jgi:hypothetical protein
MTRNSIIEFMEKHGLTDSRWTGRHIWMWLIRDPPEVLDAEEEGELPAEFPAR